MRGNAPLPDATMSKLQQQLEYHQRMVYDLKYQINQNVAISRLPPEMLSRIFRFVRDECIDNTDSLYSSASERVAWVAVSQVCRYWREVSLNEPSLWVILPVEIPKWAEVMLRRSKEAALTISLDLKNEEVDLRSSLISRILGQAHRIAHFSFLNNYVTDPALEELFTDPHHAPNLQTLCLRMSHYPLQPDSMFHGIKKLRHLELTDVAINWDSPLFKGLTRLTISNTLPIPTWSQLRTMLQGIPGLQALTLKDVLPFKNPERAFITSPIDLPSLQTLDISDQMAKCRSFFDIILCSGRLQQSNCSIIVGDKEATANVFDVLLSASLISTGKRLSSSAQSLIMGGSRDSYPFSLYMTCQRNNAENEILDPEELRREASNELSTFGFSVIGVRGNRHGGEILNAIPIAVLQVFHFQNLLELDLSGLLISDSTPEFRDTLATTCGTLPMLHSVTVGCKTASPLFDILHIRPDIHNNYDVVDCPNTLLSSRSGRSDIDLEPNPIQPPSLIPFPALTTLEICDVYVYESKREIDLDHLKECLVDRRRHGVGIRTLIFRECEQLSLQDEAEFKDLVPSLDCII